jgi:D-beta-D-heptose 7-phosphate kinase/D-beta-D-heptose 1-phosphate adenosyltransferase
MSHILETFNKIGRPQILVIGDVMLDRYTWGDAERVSPEAPVIVLRADQEEIRPGGAASVAYLLRHLDAEVFLAGVIGDDSDGHSVRAILRDEGIQQEFVLTDSGRQTTAKHRFVGRASDRHPHQILRVDHESRVPLSDSKSDALWALIQDQFESFDVILVADYTKGVCTESLLQRVIAAAVKNQQPVLVDPGRGVDYQRYRGATLLKPNRVEAELFIGKSLNTTEQARIAGRTLCEQLNLEAAIITLDRDGLIAITETDQAVITSEPRAVYDITGAGDMVLSVLGLCIAAGMSILDAAVIANTAAGLEVERFGIAPVTRREIAEKLSPSKLSSAEKVVDLNALTQLIEKCRREGKRTVFTNGCFDLLHVGHVAYLEEAASLGDLLIVAVNSDASVKRLKGPTRPIIRERERAMMLASLACVSIVVIFEPDTPLELIRLIRPDVLIKGGTTSEIVGREVVEGYGGKVCRATEQTGVSTSAIVASMQKGLA